jgi:hypothetical protein
MEATLDTRTRMGRRLGYAAVALVLLGAALAVAIGRSTGYWQLAVFGIGPDLALLAGAGRGLARGQLHPRAVPLYNTLHRFWGPAALLIAALVALPDGYVVGALAWGFHIALDRAVGYGLRTPDGFQRG